MDMSDDTDSNEIDQIDENYQERVTDDTKVLKLEKLGLQKYIDNIQKGFDKSNQIDIIHDGESDERDQIG